MSAGEPRARVPLLGRVVALHPGEGPGVLWAFLYFFCLLFGYYLLRPLREEMGIRGDVTKLHWLFTATFVVMLAAVPAFSALVSRVPRVRAIPLVYRFFLLNLLLFFALLRAEVAPVWVARAFFVWVSVYNLFVVSIFWGFLADLFASGQGKRLFGFIAAGGSAGALLGSAAVASAGARVGAEVLVLASAALLEASTRCAGRLVAWRRALPAARPGGAAGGGVRAPEEGPVGGSALAGLRETFRSPFLAGIAAQMALFTVASTFLYFNLARSVAAAIPDPGARTALFGAVDLVVNVLAILTQSLATGRIVAGLGLGVALAAVPALTAAGFAVAAAVPTFWALAAFQTLRRAAHFAVERPAREVLFTVVPREQKYKAKSFIDTVVYRGGDAASGWMHAGLAGLGLGLPALSAAALPFGLLAFAVALLLARRARVLEAAGGAGA